MKLTSLATLTALLGTNQATSLVELFNDDADEKHNGRMLKLIADAGADSDTKGIAEK